jgi:arylsulfatase A-like enzyme
MKSRRDFLRDVEFAVAILLLVGCAVSGQQGKSGQLSAFPNIILIMTDDQGWCDTGYYGHPHLKTPALDAMAREGLRFDRFYAASPVCSPTRGSCLTGRHPYRYGIFNANKGHLPQEELTLAEVLRSLGYRTGHFGKWHLGTLTRTVKDSNRGGPEDQNHYAPPWEHGFDVCFSTEAKVPTWNPMIQPEEGIQGRAKNRETGQPYGTAYWSGPDVQATENLEGDDARVIMDRAIPFIQDAVERNKPFFTVIWFHTPHAPVMAGPDYRNRYAELSEGEQHYFGCLTAMDEQIGRLREELRMIGADQDTMLWFCSDNGPEGKRIENRNQGSTGVLKGRKRSLHEGGVRVPGLLVWPAGIREPRTVSMPCCTSDYFPTIMDLFGLDVDQAAGAIDGVSLLPLIDGRMRERPGPIGFESGTQVALVDNRYKIISQDGGETYQLFDLIDDPGEANDLAAIHPSILWEMKINLDAWRAACSADRERLEER